MDQGAVLASLLPSVHLKLAVGVKVVWYSPASVFASSTLVIWVALKFDHVGVWALPV